MASQVTVFTDVPQGLLEALTDRLPHSIPLLRRLQFTSFPNGRTASSRVIVASETQAPFSTSQNGSHGGEPQPSSGHFTAAYLDLSRGPETNLWFYSTLEDSHSLETSTSSLGPDETAMCESQIMAVTNEVKRQGRAHGQLGYPNAILVGTLNNVVREVMRKHGARITLRNDYNKFIFRKDCLPPDRGLPSGMRFDEDASFEDCRVAKSRSHIPRSVETLTTFPSLFIKLDDGTPIAWGFLGADGSLSSVHCEEPYRRRGLARSVGAKVIRGKTHLYGDDTYASADVALDNVESSAMCRSLNGRPSWVVSWILLDVRE